jgi:hypothetical protein
MAKIGKPLSFEINRPAPASPAPAIPTAPAAHEKYSKEERAIISLLDAQIGNKLITKAKKNDENTDKALQSIIESSEKDLKKSLRSRYNPEAITAAINEKLRRLETTSSKHTPLSKSVYIKFLKEFLGELTPKEQPRQTGTALARRLVLPDINKPN